MMGKNTGKDWQKRCIMLLCSRFVTACSFNYDMYPHNDDDPNLVMENAEYVRMTNGNPEIRLFAEEIRQYEVKHTMELDNLSFEQYNPAPEAQEEIPDINARGKAGLAQMETDTRNVFLSGGVTLEVVSEDFSMETAEISWQDNERLLNAPGSVHIKRSDGTTMQGTGLSADVRRRSWEFESMVEGTIIEDDNN
jgi:LPS export ABC transporter protein LptC